mmetsp:Transcript_144070/g.461197  ORF Transcript_144070/g.461197 Transcript_144070/m.461197 type:complete len:303 (-) Transcript_144070:70-978(-)
MVALGPAVGVAVVRAIHLCEAIQGVRRRVGVHEVHQHHNAQAVGGIDHQFELLRGALPAGRSEEGRDVVAEAAVVRVLGNGHELHAVVAQALDARQHIPGEVCVSRDLRIAGSHADVGFVDLQVLGLRGPRLCEDVPIRGRRLPKHAVKKVGGVVLPGELRPGGHPLDPLAVVRLDPDLDLARVRQSGGAVGLIGQVHRPPAEALRGQRSRVLPIVELADEKNLLGVGEPLAEGIPILVLVEAIDPVAFGELGDAPLLCLELLFPPLVPVDPLPNLALHTFQSGVDLENLQSHWHCAFDRTG